MLDLFVTSAIAQEATATAVKQPSLLASIAPLLIVMVIFYFLLIRPQSKRAKEHQELLKSLNKGDQVVTAGGIFGEVVKVDNDKGIIHIQVAENVKIKLKQDSITEVIRP
jgi:preprotein translocase subunit YajC